uniref:Alpha-lactalbumin n=1 Tax=Lygus hesperus TaxID=30085 RepID=A0A0A9YEQ8_LYGHE
MYFMSNGGSVRKWITAMFLVTVTGTITATVYTPCDLAQNIMFRSNDDSMLFNDIYIPYIVCMAGYHNYSSTNHIRLPNGTDSYGLFGFSDELCDFKLHSYRDLDTDLECLSRLYHQDPSFLDPYVWLCGQFLTKKIACDFSAELMEPIYKDILVLTNGDHDRNIVRNAIESYKLDESTMPPTAPTIVTDEVLEFSAVYRLFTPTLIAIMISITVVVLVVGSGYYYYAQRRRRINRTRICNVTNNWVPTYRLQYLCAQKFDSIITK